MACWRKAWTCPEVCCPSPFAFMAFRRIESILWLSDSIQSSSVSLTMLPGSRIGLIGRLEVCLKVLIDPSSMPRWRMFCRRTISQRVSALRIVSFGMLRLASTRAAMGASSGTRLAHRQTMACS